LLIGENYHPGTPKKPRSVGVESSTHPAIGHAVTGKTLAGTQFSAT